jgi:hypothetical protein
MSYISQAPEVYAYNPSHVGSFQQPYQPTHTSQEQTYFNQPSYNPSPNTQTQPINRYGESQVNRVYEPLSFNYNKTNVAPVAAPITNYAYTSNHAPSLNQTVIQN